MIRLLKRCAAGAFSASLPPRYAAQTRLAQFEETLELAKISLLTHLGVAATLVLFFWNTPSRAYVMALLPMVALLTLAAMAALQFRDKLVASARMVTLGHRCTVALAVVLGTVWGTMPYALYPGADWPHRMIVNALVEGLLVGAYVLGPILPVCLGFVAPIVIGSFAAQARSGEFSSLYLTGLLTIFTIFIVFSTRKLTKLSLQRIVDRLRVDDQKETIGLLLRDFEENASDWLWETDTDDRLSHTPERMVDVADWSPSALRAQPFPNLFSEPGGRTMADAISARKPFRDQVVQVRSARSLWWRISGKPIENEAGTFVGYRGVASDVTEARRAEARIAHMANNDALTGLANRATFMAEAEAMCVAAAIDGSLRALLYLDLDGFKGVNDGLGHAAGDKLLKDVVARLQSVVPPDAILSRLGGDEFTILCPSDGIESAQALAQNLVDSIGAPFFVSGAPVNIGVSVGIAFTPTDAMDAERLLGRADLALYQAKAEGRRRFRVFREDYETALLERRRFEDDLRLALARREFELYFQPLTHIATGQVCCFEALLRWTSEARGNVPPSVFIPVAESIGLIVAIGRWALIEACKAAATWPGDIRVAVNISPQHFRTVEFIADVSLALELSGLRSDRLEIEITEGVFLDDSEAATRNLQALRARNIGVALDDFGTGYSSLSYLVKFPVDSIKIDRGFIADFATGAANRAIVDTILGLARALGLSVTAEGVETVEQALELRQRGCDLVQGFLISPPKPGDRVPEMIEAASVLRDIAAPSPRVAQPGTKAFG